MDLAGELAERFDRNENEIFLGKTTTAYWSNLNMDENEQLIEVLKTKPALEALREKQPQLEEVIYSPKRQAGLELLDLTGEEICVDYGCMWGALTIPLAKRTRFVLGVDQTLHSLEFLRARMNESGCPNIALLNADLNSMPILSNKADVAVVNGVLEWIPETGSVELKKFYGKHLKRTYEGSPEGRQRAFLQRVGGNLKEGGRLYLAIENRWGYEMLWQKDPHSHLRWTSLAPRFAANWLSKVQLGRPYVNWLYSFKSLEKLLKEAGFSMVDSYLCFPDYRFPEKIISHSNDLSDFLSAKEGPVHWKRDIKRLIENLLFRKMKQKWLAPSIVMIAHK